VQRRQQLRRRQLRTMPVSGRPLVALTVGDPAGIGPEIAERAAAGARGLKACQPVI
jgi:hypothetical protein